MPYSITTGALRLVSSAYMPSPLPRQVRWSLFARPSPSSAAFPEKSQVGSCDCSFLACSAFTHGRPARWTRLATLSIEGSDGFVAAAVSIAGWSEPVPRAGVPLT